jgi:hypothetical protein
MSLVGDGHRERRNEPPRGIRLMPAVVHYLDLKRFELATEPHSCMSTYVLLKAIAYLEDHLESGGLIHSAELTKLGPQRQMRAVASSLRSAGLIDEVQPGYFQIMDFARHSGLAVIEELERRRRTRAARKGGRARWGSKGQLELPTDADYMPPPCDPPQTPPRQVGRQNPDCLTVEKGNVGVAG